MVLVGGVDSVAVLAGLIILGHCIMFPMFMYGALMLTRDSKKPAEGPPPGTKPKAAVKSKPKAGLEAAGGQAVANRAPKRADAKNLWQPQGESDDVFMTAYDFDKEEVDETVKVYDAHEGAWFGELDGQIYPWKERGRRNTSTHSAAGGGGVEYLDPMQTNKLQETEHIRLMCELVGQDELGPEVTVAARKVVMEFLSREIDGERRVVDFDSDDED